MPHRKSSKRFGLATPAGVSLWMHGREAQSSAYIPAPPLAGRSHRQLSPALLPRPGLFLGSVGHCWRVEGAEKEIGWKPTLGLHPSSLMLLV